MASVSCSASATANDPTPRVVSSGATGTPIDCRAVTMGEGRRSPSRTIPRPTPRAGAEGGVARAVLRHRRDGYARQGRWAQASTNQDLEACPFSQRAWSSRAGRFRAAPAECHPTIYRSWRWGAPTIGISWLMPCYAAGPLRCGADPAGGDAAEQPGHHSSPRRTARSGRSAPRSQAERRCRFPRAGSWPDSYILFRPDESQIPPRSLGNLRQPEPGARLRHPLRLPGVHLSLPPRPGSPTSPPFAWSTCPTPSASSSSRGSSISGRSANAGRLPRGGDQPDPERPRGGDPATRGCG